MVEHHHMASQAIDTKRQELVEAMVAARYGLQLGLWKPYGCGGCDTSVRDVVYHLPYLSTALDTGSPTLVTDHVGAM